MLEELEESLVAQILHKGPYSEEGITLAKLRAFIEKNDYVAIGVHHDIYLNSPHETVPEDLKTIIHRPIKRAAI